MSMPSAPSRPNILFVMTDQMRSTAMGCAGVERVHTPNLDRLAAEGTRFSNAVSNTPACTPARASLLTGKHVLSHGLVQNDMCLNPAHATLGTCLTGAGYRCGYIGKLHVDGRNRGARIPPGPRRLGFDDFWAGTECNHNYFAGYYYDDATLAPVWFDCYEPEGQTALAVDFLNRQDPSKAPFCLVVSWSPPHCPYEMVPARFRGLYPADNIEFLPNATDATVQAPETRSNPPTRPAAITREEHDRRKREVIAGYYAHISAMDACMGELLHCLETNGLADKTIVVFTSDHGDMLFSHNRGWKCKPWRESVGIPMLMRWPGRIPSARVTRGPISLVDLMPTLLGLAGVEIPIEVEGVDLSAFVMGDETASQPSAYINFPSMNANWDMPGWRGVVTATHTYAATAEGPWLLYDDLADPFQMQNIVGMPVAAGIRDRLDRLTRDWLERTDDDFAPPAVIAERFIERPHLNAVLPNPPLEPVIRDGQVARKGRTY